MSRTTHLNIKRDAVRYGPTPTRDTRDHRRTQHSAETQTKTLAGAIYDIRFTGEPVSQSARSLHVAPLTLRLTDIDKPRRDGVATLPVVRAQIPTTATSVAAGADAPRREASFASNRWAPVHERSSQWQGAV
jgi:hypothetical protein